MLPRFASGFSTPSVHRSSVPARARSPFLSPPQRVLWSRPGQTNGALPSLSIHPSSRKKFPRHACLAPLVLIRPGRRVRSCRPGTNAVSQTLPTGPRGVATDVQLARSSEAQEDSLPQILAGKAAALGGAGAVPTAGYYVLAPAAVRGLSLVAGFASGCAASAENFVVTRRPVPLDSSFGHALWPWHQLSKSSEVWQGPSMTT